MSRFNSDKETEYLDTIEVTAGSNSRRRGHDIFNPGRDGGDTDKYSDSRHRKKKIKFKDLTLSMSDTFQFWVLSKGGDRYIAYSIKGKKYLLAEVREGEAIIFSGRDEDGTIFGGYNSKTGEPHIIIGFDVTDEEFLKDDNPSGAVKTMTVQELLNANNGNLDSLKGSFRVIEELAETVKIPHQITQIRMSLEKLKIP